MTNITQAIETYLAIQPTPRTAKQIYKAFPKINPAQIRTELTRLYRDNRVIREHALNKGMGRKPFNYSLVRSNPPIHIRTATSTPSPSTTTSSPAGITIRVGNQEMSVAEAKVIYDQLSELFSR